MQLSDLVKPIEEQTDDELRERLQSLRTRREEIRPAKVQHAEKAKKKEGKKIKHGLAKLLDNLTPEQIDMLLNGGDQ